MGGKLTQEAQDLVQSVKAAMGDNDALNAMANERRMLKAKLTEMEKDRNLSQAEGAHDELRAEKAEAECGELKEKLAALEEEYETHAALNDTYAALNEAKVKLTKAEAAPRHAITEHGLDAEFSYAWANDPGYGDSSGALLWLCRSAERVKGLETKLAEVKAERDNAQAFYEGQSDRSDDLQEVLHKRTVERAKLEAECAAMRAALETLNNSNMIRRSRLWGCVCDGLAANSVGAKTIDVLKAADDWQMWRSKPEKDHQDLVQCKRSADILDMAVRVRKGE